MKKRAVGLDAGALLLGDPQLIRQREEEDRKRKKEADDDPWRIKKGGLVDLKGIQGVQMAFGEEQQHIGNVGFAKESANSMDTEKKMQEYIERELRKKRQQGSARTDSNASLNDSTDGARDNLLDDSEKSKPVVEGNVAFSAAMLTSIPVVDLGIDTKLKNIEETERAKRDYVLGKANGVVCFQMVTAISTKFLSLV
ncbi:UNVERIFIED_CONTAM: hypothetical protein HDU68_009688 [Siphonaria sp. JEL0065]|nr:hypothetical protein HDU68_009688 [Siphonaria sp. JEL0065]